MANAQMELVNCMSQPRHASGPRGSKFERLLALGVVDNDSFGSGFARPHIVQSSNRQVAFVS